MPTTRGPSRSSYSDGTPSSPQYWVIDDPASPARCAAGQEAQPEYFALLLTVDILIANDIITKHLIKGPRTRYLQTWHGASEDAGERRAPEFVWRHLRPSQESHARRRNGMPSCPPAPRSHRSFGGRSPRGSHPKPAHRGTTSSSRRMPRPSGRRLARGSASTRTRWRCSRPHMEGLPAGFRKRIRRPRRARPRLFPVGHTTT